MSSKTSRYLLLHEEADLLKLPEMKSKASRVQKVRQLFKRLEARDRVTYLHKLGACRNSPFKVAADDLCQLDPWNPTSVQELQQKVDKLTTSNVELKLRVERLERFATDMENWFKRKSA